MIPVRFTVLIQYDPAEIKGWAELYREGFLPALPPIGTIIFIRKSNVSFLINKIHMIDISDKDPAGKIDLIEINPNRSREILRAMKRSYYSHDKGWECQQLADNSRGMFIEGNL